MFIFVEQLQCYTFSPIHLKDDTKQNKDKNNNNEHKWDTTKGGEVLTYGCVNSIIASWKENLPSQTPNNISIFIFNVCNNIQGSPK